MIILFITKHTNTLLNLIGYRSSYSNNDIIGKMVNYLIEYEHYSFYKPLNFTIAQLSFLLKTEMKYLLYYKCF